ncbi:unnamed protein product [Toxocara canis]|uniref:Mitochondrial import inner membrane translocase subunit TIM22 n=1 Tax=Toxocara canis TaxID=6265 RepID=A0A183VDY6_TOXCA|nr:unnamed protein product [Toxocara canis]
MVGYPAFVIYLETQEKKNDDWKDNYLPEYPRVRWHLDEEMLEPSSAAKEVGWGSVLEKVFWILTRGMFLGAQYGGGLSKYFPDKISASRAQQRQRPRGMALSRRIGEQLHALRNESRNGDVRYSQARRTSRCANKCAAFANGDDVNFRGNRHR